MANISAIKKTLYTLKAADIDAVVRVFVRWPSPFYDTNYSISCVLEIPTASALDDTVTFGGLTDVTPAGFTATFSTFSGGTTVVGTKVVVHAMASHL